MATKKRVATALAGYGNAPGYGKVKPPTSTAKITPWGKSPNSPAPAPKFTPQTKTAPMSFAVPAPADPTALPVDPTYDQQVGQYGTNKDSTIAGLEGQKRSALLGYGYTQGADGSLAYDPNNPYSQAALARVAYQQSKTGTTNGMAARGQLYAGALINAQNANDTNFNVGEDSRQKALTNFLDNVRQGETTANNDYATNVIGAGGDRVARAQDNPNYTPAVSAAPKAAEPPRPKSTGGSAQKTTGSAKRRKK